MYIYALEDNAVGRVIAVSGRALRGWLVAYPAANRLSWVQFPR